jgi:homoserine dehydrogenase
VKHVRVWVVGLGTVGRWVLDALNRDSDSLAARYGVAPTVVGVANARDGFVHDPAGIDLGAVLRLTAGGGSLTELPASGRWPTSAAGIAATDADVLVEVSSSPVDGEPGFAHMREALDRGIAVVTSNKWPVALHGLELARLARERGTAFRAESTVMSGTPVLAALIDGLAGARPQALRGVVSATANFIASRMAAGDSYDEALAAAQADGLAERDPSADVDGHDETAKAMILAGLVFGEQLELDAVVRSGVSAVASEDVRRAVRDGAIVRPVVEIDRSGSGDGELTARVGPAALDRADPLVGIDGATNAVVCRADPVGEITIAGPGAGPHLAGQGVLSDLIRVAREAGG